MKNALKIIATLILPASVAAVVTACGGGGSSAGAVSPAPSTPTVAQCTATPTLAGCATVLPTVAQCTATPSTDGCTVVLPTALQVIDTQVGTGSTAANGNTLTVNYTGWLYNATATNFKGTEFDSSPSGQPFSFVLGAGQVIAGWDQGLVGMKVGGTRTLIIPSSLAYGASGNGPIPPNAVLVFSVQLVSIQ
ncbi:MAG: FKBP-type peptidyl-prolyl cis-trans isomerase [Burkholderiales bacterium]